MLRNTLQAEFLKLITGAKKKDSCNTVMNVNPCYIGLITNLNVTVGDSGVFYEVTEPSDSEYERILVGTAPSSGSIVYPIFPTEPDYTTDSQGNVIATIENISQVMFPAAKAAYTDTIKYIGFFKTDGWNRDEKGKKSGRAYDANESLVMYAKLDAEKSIAKDTIPMFRLGALKISTN